MTHPLSHFNQYMVNRGVVVVSRVVPIGFVGVFAPVVVVFVLSFKFSFGVVPGPGPGWPSWVSGQLNFQNFLENFFERAGTGPCGQFPMGFTVVGGPVGERRVPRGVPRWGVPFGFLVPGRMGPEVGRVEVTRGQVIIHTSWFVCLAPICRGLVVGGWAGGWVGGGLANLLVAVAHGTV